MAANTFPIFPLTPNPGAMNSLLSTAMTNTKAFDGTGAAGTAMVACFTAGANGARVDSIDVHYTSTNGATASGTTAATVVRFWLNNGADNTVATNNKFLGEVEVPAQTVTALGTSRLPVISFPLSRAIPAGYKIFAGTTVAVGGTNCALLIDPNGGDY